MYIVIDPDVELKLIVLFLYLAGSIPARLIPDHFQLFWHDKMAVEKASVCFHHIQIMVTQSLNKTHGNYAKGADAGR